MQTVSNLNPIPMKKILMLQCCILVQLLYAYSLKAQTNLIQNGDFENFNSSACCSNPATNCTSNMPTINNAFSANCLTNTGWYNSHGTGDIAQNEYLENGPAVGGRTLISNNAQLIAASNQGEGIYYHNNLSLLPNTIYTLTVSIWSVSGNAQSAYIKLANGLSSSSSSTIQAVQNQTIYNNNITNLSPQKIVIDFVPNSTYSQLWFYLANSGTFNIDNIDLRVKGLYTGIDINSTICCNDPIVYNNTSLPINVTGRESITANNVTSISTSNTVLNAGVFIRFTQGTRLTSSATNNVTASIVLCKPKPFSDGLFSAGVNQTISDCNYYPYTEFGGNVQKDVTYNWTSNPTAGLNYVSNLSAAKIQIIPPTPSNNSFIYTLTATNTCGSRSSNVTYTHVGTCVGFRTGSDVNESLPTNENVLTLYPNPSKNTFTLTGNFTTEEITECAIYNNLGVEVYSKKYGKIDLLEQSIELNNPDGLYLVKIKHGNTIYDQKLLISK